MKMWERVAWLIGFGIAGVFVAVSIALGGIVTPPQVSVAQLETTRPHLLIRASQKAAIKERCGIGTESLPNYGTSRSEWYTLNAKARSYPSDFFDLEDNGGNADPGESESYAWAWDASTWEASREPLITLATAWWVQAGTAGTAQDTANVLWAKIEAWADDIRDDAVNMRAQNGVGGPLSLTGPWLPSQKAKHHDWAAEFGWSHGFALFVDMVYDTLHASDADLAEDLMEIVAAQWDKNYLYIGGGGSSSDFAYTTYPWSRHVWQYVMDTLCLRGSEGDLDGLSLYSTNFSAALLESRWDQHWPRLVQQLNHEQGQHGGGCTNGYLARYIPEAHPAILALRNTLTFYDLEDEMPVLFDFMANFAPWITTPEFLFVGGIGDQAERTFGIKHDDWHALSGAAAFTVGDSGAIHQYHAYIEGGFEPVSDDLDETGWQALYVLYADSTARGYTPTTTTKHFGFETGIHGMANEGQNGTWTIQRSGWNRATDDSTTALIVQASGNAFGANGHHRPGFGHMKIYHGTKLISDRGGWRDTDTGYHWPEMKANGLNSLQINPLDFGNYRGHPSISNLNRGGTSARNPSEFEATKYRMTWVERTQSLPRGGYVFLNLTGAYPNDVVPGSWDATDFVTFAVVDSAFRETVLYDRFIAQRIVVEAATNNVEVTPVFRGADRDSIWRFGGTRTGGTAFNAFGGSPDAESNDSDWAEYTRRGADEWTTIRMSAPEVSETFKFVVSGGLGANGGRNKGYYRQDCRSGDVVNDPDQSWEFATYGRASGIQNRRVCCDDSNCGSTADDPTSTEWTPYDNVSDFGTHWGTSALRVSSTIDAGEVVSYFLLAEMLPNTNMHNEANFAAVASVETTSDSIVVMQATASDTTLFVSFPASPDLPQLATQDFTPTWDAPARLVVTNMKAGDYTVWTGGTPDSVGVFTVSASGVGTFRFTTGSDLRIQVLPKSGGAPGPDENPPSDPANFAVTAVTDTELRLTWDPATDAEGSYPITTDIEWFTGGSWQLLNQTTANEYLQGGLTENTTYTFRILHRDAADNESSYSSEVQGTTNNAPPTGDVVAPPQPTGLIATQIGTTQVDLRWFPSDDRDTGDSGIRKYTLFRVAGPGVEAPDFTPITVYDGIATLACDSVTATLTYVYVVAATDSSGNQSLNSTAEVIQVGAGGTENFAPPAPTFLTATSLVEDTITLAWGSVVDPEGDVVDYDILELTGHAGATSVTGQPGGGNYEDSGLTPNEQYVYTIRACDESDVCSDYADTVSVRTIDTTAPTKATISGTALGQTSALVFWTIPSDNSPPIETILRRHGAGGAIVKVYATTNSFIQESSLLVGTTYKYTAFWRDAAGNIGATSDTLTLATDSPPAVYSTGGAGGSSRRRPLVVW